MKKLYSVILMSLLCIQAAWAADWFVPKQLAPTVGLGSSTAKVLSLNVCDYFDFPDGLTNEANFTDEGISIEVTSDNPSLISVREANYYYKFGKRQQIQLNQLANATGKANVTVVISKGDKTATGVLSYEYFGLITNDDSYGVSINGSTKVDVLSNDQAMSVRFDDSNCELTIVEQPSLGKCEIDTFHYDKYNTKYVRKAIVYTPSAGVVNYSRDYLRYRVSLADGTSAEARVELIIRANPFVSKIVEFLPAPGQFVNSGGSFDDASCIIGVGASSGNSSVPQASGLISLGGFGGYVIVGFDQPVMNDPRNPYGVDFSIGGNSFIADYKGVWTEPGGVMVSRDDNGNGLPDDEWYELAGSDYWFNTSHRNITMTYTDPAYNSRYTVPWTTDQELDGALLTNQFHTQPYFPDPAIYPAAAEKIKDGKLSYTGTLIRASLDKRVPSYIEFYRCPAFGYCDNKTSNSDLTVARNPYYDDENGKSTNGFDISWAVDKNGNYVELDHIDFVKIYTAGAVNAGWLGEWSTEVTGVGITTPDPNYVPQDYYINYASITQLQVPVGGTCQYEGLVFKNGKPFESGTAKWWVDDEAIGTIDNNGLFTGRSIGNTFIHFQKYADAPADSFEVEVVAMTGVLIDIEGNASTVSNDSIACVKGETIYINVESLTQNKTQLNGTSSNRYIYDTYSWGNSNPSVGSINNGTFIAAIPGETMLTVSSNIDPSLTAQIKVKVLDIPETTLIPNATYVPYHAPVGQFANGDLFTNGRNARVNMRKLTTDSPESIKLENNVIYYDFTGMEFGAYPIELATDAFGISRDYTTSIIFDADNRHSPRQLLVVSDNKLIGIPVLTEEVKALVATEYTDSLPKHGDATLVTQGAYAWVAKNGELSRYNVAKGEKVVSMTVSADAAPALSVIEDRILVNESSKVSAAYKTDLESCSAAQFIGVKADVSSLAWSADNKITIVDDTTGIKYHITPSEITAYSADDKLIDEITLAVDAVTLMAAATDNEKPVAKNSGTNIVAYERATSEMNSTRSKSSVCTDQENNYDIYMRIPEDATWVKGVERLANGNLKLKLQYEGRVDADSIVELRIEAIDHMGASVFNTCPVKFMPRIYPPSVKAMEINAYTTDSAYVCALDLKEIFVTNPSVSSYVEKNNYIYADEILSCSLPEIISVSTADGCLNINAPRGVSVSGDITVSRTISYKNKSDYGTKTVTATIPVSFSSVSSIGDVTSDLLGVYPNPATSYISVDVDMDVMVDIFTMNGVRVVSTPYSPGETINVANLPVGIYIVKVNGHGNTLTAKLVKQ